MDRCPHAPTSAVRLFDACDYVTGDPFEVLRCDACGLSRTVPVVQPDEMARYYPPAYYGAASARRFPAVVECLQRALYASRARAVERLAGGPGRVLDVGCGRGFLLDAFRRRGWEPQGTELDDRSAAFAREVLRIPVVTGLPDAWPWPDGHFDAVVLWHVLEHLPDPVRVIQNAQRVLRPGGVLMIGSPNFGSPEARLAGRAWFHLDVPRHLVHLTPEWLQTALDAAGFDAIRWSFLAPEFDAFSFVQSAENRFGLRHNALYDLLRGRAARLLGSTRIQSWAALMLAIPLGIAAVPFTSLIGLAGRGSSLTVYARRRPRDTRGAPALRTDRVRRFGTGTGENRT